VVPSLFALRLDRGRRRCQSGGGFKGYGIGTNGTMLSWGWKRNGSLS